MVIFVKKNVKKKSNEKWDVNILALSENNKSSTNQQYLQNYEQ